MMMVIDFKRHSLCVGVVAGGCVRHASEGWGVSS